MYIYIVFALCVCIKNISVHFLHAALQDVRLMTIGTNNICVNVLKYFGDKKFLHNISSCCIMSE